MAIRAGLLSDKEEIQRKLQILLAFKSYLLNMIEAATLVSFLLNIIILVTSLHCYLVIRYCEKLYMRRDLLQFNTHLYLVKIVSLRLPAVLKHLTPDMDHVPKFVLRLGNDVSLFYKAELPIYYPDSLLIGRMESIAASITYFYAMHPPLLPNPSGDVMQYCRKTNAPGESNNENYLAQSASWTSLFGDCYSNLTRKYKVTTIQPRRSLPCSSYEVTACQSFPIRKGSCVEFPQPHTMHKLKNMSASCNNI
ncbi:hypothetical protein V2J09_006012 [Rumex salicifolius]